MPDTGDDLTKSVERWDRWATAEALGHAGLSPDRRPLDPLAALAANHRSVQLLSARQWWAVASARAAGYSWTDIGQVLDLAPDLALRRYAGAGPALAS